jgi:hypothetical protein
MTPFKDRKKLSPKEIAQLSTQQWIEWRLTSIHPAIRETLLKQHAEISRLKSEYEANAWLREKSSSAIERLSKKAFQLKDEEAIDKLLKIMLSDSTDLNRVNQRLNDKVMKDAIRYQAIRGEDEIRRLAKPYDDNALKIRRRLRTRVKQSVSLLNMSLQAVGGNSGVKHCTKFEQSLRNQQKSMWRSYGEQVTLTNGETELSMLSLMEQATQNKFAETFVMLKGLEESAKALGMTWAMLTLTAPQQMHPNPTIGQNSWDGTTPTQANKWIHVRWHKAEARLRKKGIILSGFRAVEPHQDGCPHWHVIVFFNEIDSDTIEQEFRKIKEWQSDIGFKFMKDNGQARAASYAAKYVLKSMSAVNELTGEAASIETWATTWKIRRHQFFGIPSLSTWRNIRMIKECPVDPVLTPLWVAATEGRAATYIALMGGLGIKESNRPVSSLITTTENTKTVTFLFQDFRSQSFYFAKFLDKNAISKKPLGNIEKIQKVEVIHNYPSNRLDDSTSISSVINQLIKVERKPHLSLWQSKRATFNSIDAHTLSYSPNYWIDKNMKKPALNAYMEDLGCRLPERFESSTTNTSEKQVSQQTLKEFGDWCWKFHEEKGYQPGGRECDQWWGREPSYEPREYQNTTERRESQGEFLEGAELELWKKNNPESWARWQEIKSLHD